MCQKFLPFQSHPGPITRHSTYLHKRTGGFTSNFNPTLVQLQEVSLARCRTIRRGAYFNPTLVQLQAIFALRTTVPGVSKAIFQSHPGPITRLEWPQCQRDRINSYHFNPTLVQLQVNSYLASTSPTQYLYFNPTLVQLQVFCCLTKLAFCPHFNSTLVQLQASCAIPANTGLNRPFQSHPGPITR